MTPTIGRIVHYMLSDMDVTRVVQARMRTIGGTQLFTGNPLQAGNVFPMLITRVWEEGRPDSRVSGTVFLDGTDTLWATSVQEGTTFGTYSWPVKV